MMEFLRCSVGGIAYGPGEEDKAGDHPPRLPPFTGVPPYGKTFRFADNRLVNNLVNKHDTASDIDMFLTSLAVCHTVIPEYPECEEAHVHATSCQVRVTVAAIVCGLMIADPYPSCSVDIYYLSPP